MKSELHTNPVEQCCCAVVPCGTMACNMAEDKETGGKGGLSNGWRPRVSQVCF